MIQRQRRRILLLFTLMIFVIFCFFWLNSYDCFKRTFSEIKSSIDYTYQKVDGLASDPFIFIGGIPRFFKII
jgi:hypothetical protein